MMLFLIGNFGLPSTTEPMVYVFENNDLVMDVKSVFELGLNSVGEIIVKITMVMSSH